MTHVYAEDPYHRLPAGLNAVRRSLDGMIVNAIRGDGPKPTRNRRHVNESPAMPAAPCTNDKYRRTNVPSQQPTASHLSQLVVI